MDRLFHTTGSLISRITIDGSCSKLLKEAIGRGGFYDKEGWPIDDIDKKDLLAMRKQIAKLLGDLDRTEELQSVRGVRVAIYEKLHLFKGLAAIPLVMVGILDIEDPLFLNPKVTIEHFDVRFTLRGLLISISNQLRTLEPSPPFAPYRIRPS